jgi:hypothetical protein
MFTLIIPTMWKSKIFHKAIMEYKKTPKISEIIIINNDPNFNIPAYFKHPKIKILTQTKNIYVNPAWNLGVSVSKNENIAIVNDDIFIEKMGWVLGVLEKHFKKYNLLGLDLTKSNKVDRVEIENLEGKKRPNGFGTCMVLQKKNYVTIPDEIKIWYGDDILYYTNKNRGKFSVQKINFEMSKTVNSVKGVKEIITKNDRPNFKKYIKENNIVLN